MEVISYVGILSDDPGSGRRSAEQVDQDNMRLRHLTYCKLKGLVFSSVLYFSPILELEENRQASKNVNICKAILRF